MRLEYYHLIIFKRSNDNQNVLEKINGRIRAILFFGQRYFGSKTNCSEDKKKFCIIFSIILMKGKYYGTAF